MAPTIAQTLRSLLPRATPIDTLGSSSGPLAEHSALLSAVSKRDDDDDPDPTYGVLDPHDISNVGFFVLFALIGVAFVCVGIWFFFWARNGGFHFKKDDWDDYKTTVLRRKGPNGTLLSGATESTNLGGGSVYKDVADEESTVYNAGYARFGRRDGKPVRERDDDDQTVVTEGTAMTGITAGPSDIGAREKRKAKKEMRERDREHKRKEKAATEKEARSSKRHVTQGGVVEDEEAERAAKKHLRSYRHERPARVGGLNKESEGSQWDGSTNPTDSTVSSSLLSGQQSTPTSTPTKDTKGIRKVYSTTDKVEAERLKQEARRRRREERAAAGSPGARTSRRDFSYQIPGADSTVTESLLEGSQSGISEETGTKSYHHPRPELRTQGREQRQKEREDRRERRKGGYRRGRGEDDDEL